MDHGPSGVCAGVAGETSLWEVVDPVDDRVDAAVEDGRQVEDVFHNHRNLGKCQGYDLTMIDDDFGVEVPFWSNCIQIRCQRCPWGEF